MTILTESLHHGANRSQLKTNLPTHKFLWSTQNNEIHLKYIKCIVLCCEHIEQSTEFSVCCGELVKRPEDIENIHASEHNDRQIAFSKTNSCLDPYFLEE